MPPKPANSAGTFRVLDAAANRAAEAVRVVEDYTRFVLDDAHLTGLLKQLRHDLAAAVAGIPATGRVACRDTSADVGTTLSTESEGQRADARVVATAGCKRLEQALRSLEEFGKLLDPDLSKLFEALRYRAYTLERAVEGTATSLERLASARLYVLVEGGRSPEQFAATIETLAAAGVDVIQLRDKSLGDRQFLERARLACQITRRHATLLIVNDRPDLAVLAGADGVHVGQDELTVKDARAIVGPELLIGVSTHSLSQARQAVLDGASYLGCGPTFASRTKHFDQFPGTPLLREVAGEIRLPAFAIGGIAPENLPQVIEAGFTRVAVGQAITAADDPQASVVAIRNLLDAAAASDDGP